MDAAHIPGAGMVTPTLTSDSVRSLLDSVVDPEIPVLTIADLGILREVEVDGEAVTVIVTPTYSGCPAMEHIEGEIVTTLAKAGVPNATVKRSYSPEWTTDWMTDEARAKLASVAIAPPAPVAGTVLPVLCPQCGSAESKTISEFGSTACKALMVCDSCREPFDRFKAI